MPRSDGREAFFRLALTSLAVISFSPTRRSPYCTATEGCSLIFRYIIGCV